jgi:hypothetical protein
LSLVHSAYLAEPSQVCCLQQKWGRWLITVMNSWHDGFPGIYHLTGEKSVVETKLKLSTFLCHYTPPGPEANGPVYCSDCPKRPFRSPSNAAAGGDKLPINDVVIRVFADLSSLSPSPFILTPCFYSGAPDSGASFFCIMVACKYPHLAQKRRHRMSTFHSNCCKLCRGMWSV